MEQRADTSAKSPHVVRLDYQKRTHHRRYARIALIVFILAVSIVGWKWGPTWWAMAKYEYEWRRCCKLALPEDKIVYEEDPVNALALLKRPNYVRLSSGWWNRRAPKGWIPPVGFEPPDAHVASINPGLGLVLCHKMKTPSGESFLVCVTAWPSNFGQDGHLLSISCNLLLRGDYRNGPSYSVPFDRLCMLNIPAKSAFRMCAGQVDARDPTHFIISYVADGQSGHLEGWLRDHEPEPGGNVMGQQVAPAELNWHLRDGPVKECVVGNIF